jgi:hypothetical protein
MVTGNSLFMKFILIIFILIPINVLACLPNEIHIHEQWINSYTKEDGIVVSAHVRSEHCRELKGNYFQNSTTNEFKGLKTKFKKWTENEKSLLNKEIENLPTWLRKYQLSDVLRATQQEGNPNNPAMTIPSAKALILFDKFFTMPNKRDVIIHEFAHIAVWDFSPDDLKKFLIANGWNYRNGQKPIPPEKTFKDDSKDSPSEDFANIVEAYYSTPDQLKKFNEQSFFILDQMIKQKERQP